MADAARRVTATAVLVSAVAPLYLRAQGVNQVDVIGPAFPVNDVGGVVLAIVFAVVAWRAIVAWRAVVVAPASTG